MPASEKRLDVRDRNGPKLCGGQQQLDPDIRLARIPQTSRYTASRWRADLAKCPRRFAGNFMI
jgi:hypothetical protein